MTVASKYYSLSARIFEAHGCVTDGPKYDVCTILYEEADNCVGEDDFLVLLTLVLYGKSACEPELYERFFMHCLESGYESVTSTAVACMKKLSKRMAAECLETLLGTALKTGHSATVKNVSNLFNFPKEG